MFRLQPFLWIALALFCPQPAHAARASATVLAEAGPGTSPDIKPDRAPELPPYCASGEDYDAAVLAAGVDALRAYAQRCGGDGKYRLEAARELESRLFVAASDCIRRAPGCDFDACIGGYERELAEAPRAAGLRSQAAALAASKAECRPAPPEPLPLRDLQPESAVQPDWCARASGRHGDENLICSDPDLGALDIKMTELYRARLATLRGLAREEFARFASIWVAARGARCGDLAPAPGRPCLEGMMRGRIAALQGEGGGSFERPAWCARARGDNPNETLICANARLSGLDNRLNDAYQARLGELSGALRGEFARAEAGWVRRRDSTCREASAAGSASCLMGFMQDRLSELGGN